MGEWGTRRQGDKENNSFSPSPCPPLFPSLMSMPNFLRLGEKR
ncbi:hypothetical protein [Tolypothrix sp. VBCCA 56010]